MLFFFLLVCIHEVRPPRADFTVFSLFNLRPDFAECFMFLFLLCLHEVKHLRGAFNLFSVFLFLTVFYISSFFSFAKQGETSERDIAAIFVFILLLSPYLPKVRHFRADFTVFFCFFFIFLFSSYLPM